MELLEPKVIDVECQDGSVRQYTISKFPALTGREIVTQYPTTAAPKIGEYKTNEELMLKLMAFVAVARPDGSEGAPIQLRTRALVDNHVPDFEALLRIEWAMLEYNCSFFEKGKLSNILAAVGGKFQALIIETLTGLKPQSSPKESPPSKN